MNTGVGKNAMIQNRVNKETFKGYNCRCTGEHFTHGPLELSAGVGNHAPFVSSDSFYYMIHSRL